MRVETKAGKTAARMAERMVGSMVALMVGSKAAKRVVSRVDQSVERMVGWWVGHWAALRADSTDCRMAVMWVANLVVGSAGMKVLTTAAQMADLMVVLKAVDSVVN